MNQKTRQPVRHVFFSESSSNVGGQELQMLAQAAGLMARGVEVVVLCPPGGRVARLAAERNIEVAPVAFRNSLHPPSIAAVARLMARRRPAAVICHSGHDANTVAIAARLTTARRSRLLRSRTYQHGLAHAWTYNHLFDRALVPSEEMRRCLLSNPQIRPERIRVLYPGIDLTALAAGSAEKLPQAITEKLARSTAPLLVHAAMLRPEKGHLLMLDVLAALRQRGVMAAYAMAGEGGMEPMIRARIQALGLGECAWLLGNVANVAALYARADLVVMPSLYEPLGMSQIEALALGTPVIGSRVGGIPETIADGVTGLLAKGGDAADWTEKLAWALSQPDAMRAMAAHGRADVHARFAMPAHLDQLMLHIQDA